jgi:hypothetical protein
MNVVTTNLCTTRDQIPAPSDPGDAGLPIRGLGGVLGGWLEQTAVRLYSHAGSRRSGKYIGMTPRIRPQQTARARNQQTGFRPGRSAACEARL